MTYKELLLKINTLPDDIQAAARKKALQGKIDKIPAASVWDMLQTGRKNTDQEKNFDSTKLKRDHDEISPAASVPEIVNGEAVRDDDYINGLYLPDVENKIYQSLDDFINTNDIDDMKKAPYRLWRAASCYIGKNLFKPTKLLKQNNNINNAYDIDKIKAVLSIYTYMCDVYNKPITIDACEMFLGVHDGYLSENKEKLTLAGSDLWKKSESSIAAGIIDGKTSPVGALAHLNHYFSWDRSSNNPAAASVNVAVYPVLSAAAVPSLPDNDKM